MVLMKLKTRTGIVNLFADYILSKIGSNTKTIIQVTDCDSFFVVNGQTEKEYFINLHEISKSFESDYREILEDRKINTIDLIKYGVEPKTNNNIWFTFLFEDNLFYLKKMIHDDFEIDPLQVSSEFPFGYGLPIDRNKLYYSEYVCNHIHDSFNTDTIKFKFSSDIVDEEPNIVLIGDFKYDTNHVKSMILDVFDFNLDSFSRKIESYDILRDLTNPFEVKPWMVLDMKKEMWIF